MSHSRAGRKTQEVSSDEGVKANRIQGVTACRAGAGNRSKVQNFQRNLDELMVAERCSGYQTFRCGKSKSLNSETIALERPSLEPSRGDWGR